MIVSVESRLPDPKNPGSFLHQWNDVQSTAPGSQQVGRFRVWGAQFGLAFLENIGQGPVYIQTVSIDGTRHYDASRTSELRVDPNIPLSDKFHVLREGEAFPLHVGPPDFDRNSILTVKTFAEQFFMADPADEHDDELFDHLLSLMGDNGAEDDDLPREESLRDLGWLTRNYAKRYQGEHDPYAGPLNPFMERDGDGTSNARYESLAWQLISLLKTPTLYGFWMFVAHSAMHIATGIYHSGPYRGAPRNEKGVGMYGAADDRHLWSKDWPWQLFLTSLFIPHFFYRKAWSEYVEFATSTPGTWWEQLNGQWGARGAAFYLRAMTLIINAKGMPGVSDAHVEKARANIHTMLDSLERLALRAGEEPMWWNDRMGERTLQSEAQTSPWMIFNLIGAAAIAIDTLNPESDEDHDRWYSLLNAVYRVARTLGTSEHTVETAPSDDESARMIGVHYRFGGPEAHPKHADLTAFLVEAAWQLGHTDDALRAGNFVFKRWPFSWEQAKTTFYARFSPKGIDWPSGGPNFSKAVKITLHGFRK